ncbi:MAG: hypothetical protein WDM77_07310 [Steroidobacteraceae bacterium]
MSPEDREESQAYLNALWAGYQTQVDSARKLPSGSVARYTGSLSQAAVDAKGDLAQIAQKAHLVTDIKTAAAVEHRVADITGG